MTQVPDQLLEPRFVGRVKKKHYLAQSLDTELDKEETTSSTYARYTGRGLNQKHSLNWRCGGELLLVRLQRLGAGNPKL